MIIRVRFSKRYCLNWGIYKVCLSLTLIRTQLLFSLKQLLLNIPCRVMVRRYAKSCQVRPPAIPPDCLIYPSVSKYAAVRRTCIQYIFCKTKRNIADIFNIVIFCRGVLLFQAAVTPYVSELIFAVNGRIDFSLTDVNHAMLHMLFMLLRLHIRPLLWYSNSLKLNETGHSKTYLCAF